MQTKTMEPFNYEQALRVIIKRGKALCGPDYDISEEQEPIVRKLLTWFLHDEAQAAVEGISLEKGILLSRPVGCGKTTIMTILQSLSRKKRPFMIVACYDVAIDYADMGSRLSNRILVTRLRMPERH
ncbi:hypothetical protein F0L74_21520 [Chitinophaga agrisoli]|uniref:Uncharacterized protein n=1 Tax=Chitinophaga agrisoli TaxID=2607653 RepID=A0A5B2VKL7_9BACT|nr:hypothetical protein [Chitinophaga agrisoli]KAA2238797.1 hypothetical protein F0L74_21520 [Chitinophaga agrisoli]